MQRTRSVSLRWLALAVCYIALRVSAASIKAETQLSGDDKRQKILAFGDSLTEGATRRVGGQDSGKRVFHPYSLMLQKLLTAGGYDAVVEQLGISGERVTQAWRGSEGMHLRLPDLLKDAEAKGVSYDWVLILGGINDLTYKVMPDKVFEGLLKMYVAAGKHGAKVLAMTCMERQSSRVGQKDARAQLNALIRSVPGTVGFEHVTLLDLEKALPYTQDSPDPELAALWDDGLHLTAKGYDEFGLIVYKALKGKLSKA